MRYCKTKLARVGLKIDRLFEKPVDEIFELKKLI